MPVSLRLCVFGPVSSSVSRPRRLCNILFGVQFGTRGSVAGYSLMDLRKVAEDVLALATRLALIPAPTFYEETRLKQVEVCWAESGLKVRRDKVGNLWAKIREGTGPALMVCAHADTVFSAEIPHQVSEESGRLVGPGIGDNSLGVAAISKLAEILPETVPGRVWIVATTAEEGIGNLAGVTHALENPPEPIDAMVAIEGTLFGSLVTTAVGSVRWRVVLEGEGGHAWHAADTPSAIHALGHLIVKFDELGKRCLPAASVNVGRIEGGEGINIRAKGSWFELDVRADDQATLDSVTHEVTEIFDSIEEVVVLPTVIGQRPAGKIDHDHPLARSAAAALEEVGVAGSHIAASTDANACYPVGIPAIAIGITKGGNEHTVNEWIEIEPVQSGLEALGLTLMYSLESLSLENHKDSDLQCA